MLSQNFMLEQDPLSLDRIRSVLVRLEDTIIFDLIERAQFATNPRIYTRGAFPELKDLGFDGSWLEWFLKEIETFHGLSPLTSAKHSPHPHYHSQSAQIYQVRHPRYVISPCFQVRITNCTVPTNIRLRAIFLHPF